MSPESPKIHLMVIQLIMFIRPLDDDVTVAPATPASVKVMLDYGYEPLTWLDALKVCRVLLGG